MKPFILRTWRLRDRSGVELLGDRVKKAELEFSRKFFELQRRPAPSGDHEGLGQIAHPAAAAKMLEFQVDAFDKVTGSGSHDMIRNERDLMILRRRE